MVERSTVNAEVAGSSPASGAKCGHEFYIKLLPNMDIFTSGNPKCKKCGYEQKRYKSDVLIKAENYLLGIKK